MYTDRKWRSQKNLSMLHVHTTTHTIFSWQYIIESDWNWLFYAEQQFYFICVVVASNAGKWPPKLQMNLIPNTLLSPLQSLFRNSRTVGFNFMPKEPEALSSLFRVMAAGFVSSSINEYCQDINNCCILSVNYSVILWAQERCRLTPSHLLAECRKRRLNQGSFVLLYFVLFAFLSVVLNLCTFLSFLICLLSCIFQREPTWMVLYSVILLMCR